MPEGRQFCFCVLIVSVLILLVVHAPDDLPTDRLVRVIESTAPVVDSLTGRCL